MAETAQQPRRIQRSRTKGWRTPAGAVFVGRPTRWGNPWRVAGVQEALLGAMDTLDDAASHLALSAFVVRTLMRDDAMPILPATLARHAAIELYHDLALAYRHHDPAAFDIWLRPLRGRDLICWCPIGERCHADVLLELARGLA